MMAELEKEFHVLTKELILKEIDDTLREISRADTIVAKSSMMDHLLDIRKVAEQL